MSSRTRGSGVPDEEESGALRRRSTEAEIAESERRYRVGALRLTRRDEADTFLLTRWLYYSSDDALLREWAREFRRACQAASEDSGADALQSEPKRLLLFLEVLGEARYAPACSERAIERVCRLIESSVGVLSPAAVRLSVVQLPQLSRHRAPRPRLAASQQLSCAPRRAQRFSKSSVEAALHELTLRHAALVLDVGVADVLECGRPGAVLATSLQALLQQADEDRRWALGEVLRAEPALRHTVLQRFVRLLALAVEANNFLLAASLNSALDDDRVRRLAGVWRRLAQRSLDGLDALRRKLAAGAAAYTAARPPKLPDVCAWVDDMRGQWANSGSGRSTGRGMDRRKQALLASKALDVLEALDAAAQYKFAWPPTRVDRQDIPSEAILTDLAERAAKAEVQELAAAHSAASYEPYELHARGPTLQFLELFDTPLVENPSPLEEKGLLPLPLEEVTKEGGPKESPSSNSVSSFQSIPSFRRILIPPEEEEEEKEKEKEKEEKKGKKKKNEPEDQDRWRRTPSVELQAWSIDQIFQHLLNDDDEAMADEEESAGNGRTAVERWEWIEKGLRDGFREEEAWVGGDLGRAEARQRHREHRRILRRVGHVRRAVPNGDTTRPLARLREAIRAHAPLRKELASVPTGWAYLFALLVQECMENPSTLSPLLARLQLPPLHSSLWNPLNLRLEGTKTTTEKGGTSPGTVPPHPLESTPSSSNSTSSSNSNSLVHLNSATPPPTCRRSRLDDSTDAPIRLEVGLQELGQLVRDVARQQVEDEPHYLRRLGRQWVTSTSAARWATLGPSFAEAVVGLGRLLTLAPRPLPMVQLRLAHSDARRLTVGVHGCGDRVVWICVGLLEALAWGVYGHEEATVRRDERDRTLCVVRLQPRPEDLVALGRLRPLLDGGCCATVLHAFSLAVAKDGAVVSAGPGLLRLFPHLAAAGGTKADGAGTLCVDGARLSYRAMKAASRRPSARLSGVLNRGEVCVTGVVKRRRIGSGRSVQLFCGTLQLQDWREAVRLGLFVCDFGPADPLPSEFPFLGYLPHGQQEWLNPTKKEREEEELEEEEEEDPCKNTNIKTKGEKVVVEAILPRRMSSPVLGHPSSGMGFGSGEVESRASYMRSAASELRDPSGSVLDRAASSLSLTSTRSMVSRRTVVGGSGAAVVGEAIERAMRQQPRDAVAFAHALLEHAPSVSVSQALAALLVRSDAAASWLRDCELYAQPNRSLARLVDAVLPFLAPWRASWVGRLDRLPDAVLNASEGGLLARIVTLLHGAGLHVPSEDLLAAVALAWLGGDTPMATAKPDRAAWARAIRAVVSSPPTPLTAASAPPLEVLRDPFVSSLPFLFRDRSLSLFTMLVLDLVIS